jgi:O-acetylhomoserine/O-acetylserine sulfhydrylase-like pyridoxal-dependent enzyme
MIVDNTLRRRTLCRRSEWGADIVVHSSDEVHRGHGTSIGGVVVDSAPFNWSNGAFQVIAEASRPQYHGLLFHETSAPTDT